MLDLDNITIGQAKQIASFLSNCKAEEKGNKSGITDRMIGKYVICRTRNEGINFGKVLIADETGCVLEEARRIYYHKPKDNKLSWYEGVATTGLSPDSKISGSVPSKTIIEDYSLTECTEVAIESLINHESTGS